LLVLVAGYGLLGQAFESISGEEGGVYAVSEDILFKLERRASNGRASYI
jgi:hypothetical protein